MKSYVNQVKRYVVYGTNKSWRVATLERAMKVVEMEIRKNFRMSIFEDNKEIAFYENEKRVF